jgi:hypothetical protein
MKREQVSKLLYQPLETEQGSIQVTRRHRTAPCDVRANRGRQLPVDHAVVRATPRRAADRRSVGLRRLNRTGTPG